MRMPLHHALWIAPLIILFLTVRAGAQPASAVVVRIKGSVEIRKNDAAPWTKASGGMSAGTDASIRTGANSEAYLAWKENSVRIGPMSVISIDKLMEGPDGVSITKLRVSQGAVFTKAQKLNNKSTFEIQTPTAIAGVRGTSFEASLKRFAVTEGNIFVSAGGKEVEVPAGQMVEVSDDGMLSDPVLIPATLLKELYELDKQCGEVISEEMRCLGAQDKGQGCLHRSGGDKQQQSPPGVDQSMDESNTVTEQVVDVIDMFGDITDQYLDNACDVNIFLTY